ncbi:helix-turn-helix domain-containing protein [Saccharopolyspora shandongensis]|uniref:helix-turn-helix domain-containing protein n=1 Tax=Saccharopolyspora shandongensis TaxID=418495 RepID=UPI00340424B9
MPGDPRDPDVEALATSVGRAMRQARQDAGMTLQALAARTGLSQPFLSQLENGRSMPSLISLHKVAVELNTTVQALLTDEEHLDISLVRKGEGRTYELAENVQVRFLVRGVRTMEPNEVIAEPHADAGGHTEHAGEEVIHVLEGSIQVRFGSGRVERLDAGDTICYRATVPHRWQVVGEKRARFLIVSSPPSF